MLQKTYYKLGAALTMGMIAFGPSAAMANATPPANNAASGNTFSNIAENITGSVSSLPGLLSALSYLLGLVLGVLGIIKIKDHVENPQNAKLADGAIRLAAGGALFALPIIFEAMFNTVGDTSQNVGAASLNKVEFNLN